MLMLSEVVVVMRSTVAPFCCEATLRYMWQPTFVARLWLQPTKYPIV